MSDRRTNTNTERIHRLDEQDRLSTVTWHARAAQRVASTAFPRFLRAFALAFGVIAGAAALSIAAAADKTAAEFISALGSDVIAEMRSAASLDQKLSYFRQMLSQDFDLEGIARFVLGPYWRTASPEQQQEFRGLLAKHIMLSHGRRLAESNGGDFRVTGSRTDPNGVVFVTGEITTPQGTRNEVDFQLGIVDGRYKIQDVAIDNVSMVLSYRSEIATVLAGHGGQLGALLTTMREERCAPLFGRCRARPRAGHTGWRARRSRTCGSQRSRSTQRRPPTSSRCFSGSAGSLYIRAAPLRSSSSNP